MSLALKTSHSLFLKFSYVYLYRQKPAMEFNPPPLIRLNLYGPLVAILTGVPLFFVVGILSFLLIIIPQFHFILQPITNIDCFLILGSVFTSFITVY